MNYFPLAMRFFRTTDLAAIRAAQRKRILDFEASERLALGKRNSANKGLTIAQAGARLKRLTRVKLQ